MKLNRLKIFMLILPVMFQSCQNRKEEIAKIMMDFSHSKINICTDSMYIGFNDSLFLKEKKIKCELSLIDYTDSSTCFSCYLSHLKSWEEFITEEKLSNKFKCYHIFEVSSSDRLNLKKFVENVDFPDLYIDSLGVFRRQNPQLPKDKMFHTFLLNENDSVVFVGDPMTNDKLKELFLKIVNGNEDVLNRN